jgi:hypothetical protein
MEHTMSEQVMISIRVSNTMSIQLKHHAEPVTFDWSKVPEDKRQQTAEYLFDFSLRQSPSDADASLKDKTIAVKKAAVKAKFDKLQLGETPSGGGGRGSTLDDISQAMFYLLNEGRKTADKIAVKDYAKFAKAYFREQITAQAIKDEMDPKELGITSIVDDNWQEMVKDRIGEPDGQTMLERVKKERQTVEVSKVSATASKWLKKKAEVETETETPAE